VIDMGDFLQNLDPCRGEFEVDRAVESGVPGFGDPWHAEAFGTSLALSRAGLFAWAEWVEVFSKEIRANPQRAGEDSESAYYRQWLAALETILVKHATLTSEEIAAAAEHWRRSYLNTPHGKPIVFSRDWQDVAELGDEDLADHHHHHHGHHHSTHGTGCAPRPVAVSAPVAAKEEPESPLSRPPEAAR
jgi:nitrile hydratase accessory protein